MSLLAPVRRWLSVVVSQTCADERAARYSAESQLESLRRENGELREQLDDYRGRYNESFGATVSQSSRLAALERTLAERDERIANLSDDLRHERGRCAESELEIGVLKLELQKARTEEKMQEHVAECAESAREAAMLNLERIRTTQMFETRLMTQPPRGEAD